MYSGLLQVSPPTQTVDAVGGIATAPLRAADLEPPRRTPGLYCVIDEPSRAEPSLRRMLDADFESPEKVRAQTFSAGAVAIALAGVDLADSLVSLASTHRAGTTEPLVAAFFGELNEVASDDHRRSCADILLEQYLAHGASCARYLDGLFHFLILEPARRMLIVGTDRWALRPLFYSGGTGGVAVAPSARALLPSAGPPRIDREAAGLLLVFGFVPGDRTLLEGIREIPPGTIFTWKDGASRIASYRDVHFPSTYRNRPERVEVDELSELLSRAVAARFTPAERVTLPLSGGFDSRTLLSFVPHHERAVELFTYGAPGCDDLTVAERIAEMSGYPWHPFLLEPGYIEAWAPEVVRSTSGLHPCLQAHGLALRSLRRFGTVTVLGNGGDALFGYHYPCPQDMSRADIADLLLARANHGVPWSVLPSLLGPEALADLRDLAGTVIRTTLERADSDRGLDILTYFDLRERQRRFVNVGIQTQSSHVRFVEPYYDGPVVEFALGLAPALRDDRRLLRLVLDCRNPQLAGVPRQGTRLSALPSRHQQLRWRARRETKRWVERGRNVLGRFVPLPRLARPFNKSSFSDHEFHTRHYSRVFVEGALLDPVFVSDWIEQRGVETIVNRHMQGRENNAAAIGVLLTIELAARMFRAS
jgi:asparagine synthase (glutamine-hydrolysing)